MQRNVLYSLSLSALIALAPLAGASARDLRDTVHDSYGNTVHSSFGHCVRTAWVSDSDECAAPRAERRVRTPVAQEDRTVYFAFNRATLSPEARRRLDSLAGVLSSDKDVREARIVGYADRIGSASYNEGLSKKRAQNVQRYLTERGFVNSRVTETRWLGESSPRTQCPDTLSRERLIACLQKDRRVEVEIDYLPGGEAGRR